jgi:hypothetical protein
MRARDAYRVLHTRSGRTPARFADPARSDLIEVVEVASGEVVLFWEDAARDSAKRARRLREDLNMLEVEDFLARWGEA